MKAKKNELWLKSLVLGQEFDRYVLEHPSFAERIPHGAEVVLLPNYDQELREYNLRNSKVNTEPGRPIVHIEIGRLRPRHSQIVRPKMKVLSKAGPANAKQRLKKSSLSAA